MQKGPGMKLNDIVRGQIPVGEWSQKLEEMCRWDDSIVWWNDVVECEKDNYGGKEEDGNGM